MASSSEGRGPGPYWLRWREDESDGMYAWWVTREEMGPKAKRRTFATRKEVTRALLTCGVAADCWVVVHPKRQRPAAPLSPISSSVCPCCCRAQPLPDGGRCGHYRCHFVEAAAPLTTKVDAATCPPPPADVAEAERIIDSGLAALLARQQAHGWASGPRVQLPESASWAAVPPVTRALVVGQLRHWADMLAGPDDADSRIAAVGAAVDLLRAAGGRQR
jgi:hypothetical protein